jgi:ribonuclease P protein component
VDERFPAACRLKGKKNIQAVYAARDTFYGKRLVFYRRKRENEEQEALPAVSRFCFAVPRACGNAVRRNRIKRILREIVRTNRYRIDGGIDYIIKVQCNRLDPDSGVTRDSFLDDFQSYYRWT